MTDGFLTIFGHRDNLFARQSDYWSTSFPGEGRERTLGTRLITHFQVSDFRLKFAVSFPLRPGRKCVVAVSGNTLEARWTA